MGLSGISIWQLLIILAIVFVLFGSSRLKNFGSDLGSAIKGFRKSMSESPKGESLADNAQEHERIKKPIDGD